jgi:hypothetical protein
MKTLISLPDWREVQLDHEFRPATALSQGCADHPARHRARGDRPQQSDRGGLGRPTGRAVGPPEDRLWQGDRRQSNAALTGRQWFHPKDTLWRQTITKKAEENAAQIRPQIQDDEAPANYFRALRDVAA